MNSFDIAILNECIFHEQSSSQTIDMSNEYSKFKLKKRSHHDITELDESKICTDTNDFKINVNDNIVNDVETNNNIIHIVYNCSNRTSTISKNCCPLVQLDISTADEIIASLIYHLMEITKNNNK